MNTLRRVLFYFENDWAFGQIYNALTRRLAKRGICAHVLDWRIRYSEQEMGYLMLKFDAIVTIPSVVDSLLSNGVPPWKIIALAWHEKDIVFGASKCGVGMFEGLRGYGVVHEHMLEVSRNAGINRVPMVVPQGIDFDYLYEPIGDGLSSLGYAGAISSGMSDGSDFKRSYLLKQIAESSGLPLLTHDRMYHMCVAGYYRTIDSLLVTSKYEGYGLPAIEAAAAGRLVLGARVGSFDGNLGLVCRTPDEEFVADAVEHLNRCKDPTVYKEECERAQQYARDHYDWEHVLDKNIELLN